MLSQFNLAESFSYVVKFVDNSVYDRVHLRFDLSIDMNIQFDLF